MKFEYQKILPYNIYGCTLNKEQKCLLACKRYSFVFPDFMNLSSKVTPTANSDIIQVK
jgi:hypothetical protein